MQDAHSVLTEATKGHVEELARRMEIGLRRMYAILESDWYPKTKRRFRDIAAVNPDGARLIRADLDAMWLDIFGDETPDVTAAEMVRELNEAEEAELEEKSSATRLKENREAIVVLSQKNQQIEREAAQSAEVLRRCSKAAVSDFRSRRNGQR